jgi:two-component system, LytTR family, response regulator
MIRCLVIDDEPYARELLSEFIIKLPNLKLEGAYSSALSALPALSKKAVDVIFLDIQMPDISGIDFLKTLDKRPCVIFTTAFAEYALEGFELDVVDYLLKPFDFNRFLRAVNKLTLRMEKTAPATYPAEKAQGRSPDFIFIKDGNKLVKVELKNILFIKGTREYVTIHTRDKKIMSLQTLKNLETELPAEFIRVHNSYIVFIPSVGTISKNEVEIEGEIIPIGITYKKNFLERIRIYFPGKELGE